MRNLILTIFTLLFVLSTFQKAFGQNSTIIKGKVIDYISNQYLPSAKIRAFNKKIIVGQTKTNFEDGSFTLLMKNNSDKLIISNDYYYPLIIENIDKIRINDLNLGKIPLVQISFDCTRYASKIAERKGDKVEKMKFRKLKEGTIIEIDKNEYKMRLKKKKGKFSFYIDFKDFQIK